MRHMFIVFNSLILLCYYSIYPRQAEAEYGPRAVVEAFQADLIETMKVASGLAIPARVEKLNGPVERAFHLLLIARIAGGGHWDSANDDQRRRFAAAFKRMSLSTLATYFDGYSGERFETVAEGEGPQKTHLVQTMIVKADGSRISIDYVMRKFDRGWRIIDVILDKGISELSVRRSEYALVLRERGIEGLISALEAKADELARQ